MTSQTTLPALEPLPPVVEAVRAAGVRLSRSRTGSLVGHCPVCARHQQTIYVSERGGWWACFGCGVRGTAANAAERLKDRKGRAA